MDITKLITPPDPADQAPTARRSSPESARFYPPTATAKPISPQDSAQTKVSPVRSASASVPQKPPNDFRSDPTLSEEEKDEASQLQEAIRKDRHDYYSRTSLIQLLHRAFARHARTSNSAETAKDPQVRERLGHLRTAREEMDALFAIHEQFWLDWIEDEAFAAQSIPECVRVIDICRQAVQEECASAKIWTAYTDWVCHLYYAAQSEESAENDRKWSQKDRETARGVFTWQFVLETFTKAAQTLLYRLDNTEIWDKYFEIILKNLDASPTPENAEQTKSSFVTRLQVPHRTWDDTFQTFSQFVSKNFPSNYENIMVDVRAKTAPARAQWEARELREDALAAAVKEDNSGTTELRLYSEYIDWECMQDRRHRRTSFELITAVYERALLRFPTNVLFWNDYVLHLIEEKMTEDAHLESRRSQTHRRPRHAPESTMPALERATRHCPFSGTLWSQYILCAEREGHSFEEISMIKHKATSTGILESAGVREVADVYTTFCSYLHRLASQPDSTDDAHLIGEVGIRSALEHLKKVAGDTNMTGGAASDTSSNPAIREIVFRLEKMYIQYLSDRGSYDTARERFKSLVHSYGHLYDFWSTYYIWELQCWDKFAPSDGTKTERRADPPGYATAVLKLAMERVGADLDEPHEAMATYLAHCEDYETADGLQEGIILLRKTAKVLTRRLEKEYAQAQLSAAQYDQQQQQYEKQQKQQQQQQQQKQKDQSQPQQQQRYNAKSIDRPSYPSKGIRKEKAPSSRPSSSGGGPLFQQPVRRPAQPTRSSGGRRGGLGVKRGRFSQIVRTDSKEAVGDGGEQNGEAEHSQAAPVPKSNSDFRALVTEARSGEKSQVQKEADTSTDQKAEDEGKGEDEDEKMSE